jgi:hypothetical protein
MRKSSTVVGLTVAMLAATASAQPAAPQRRGQAGLSFMPMGLGKFTASPGGATTTTDAAFAFGAAVSVGYMVIPGLVVGIAPQVIFNVKPKEDPEAGAKEYDLMARVAYALPVVDTIAVYAEALPGYSLLSPPSGDTAKGLVVAFGAGVTMDLSDQVFANLGLGYQIGFQKLSGVEVSARYLRVALGAGVRF